jgi:glycosyltransferase involved in cell wall biosynthesis
VNRLLAVSEYIRAKCVVTYPIAAGRVSVWYPGVGIGRFSFCPEARCRVREAACVSDQHYIIGYAARITRKKGFEDLFTMMKNLRDRVPEARLWLIGGVAASEQEYEQELRTLVHRLELDSIVSFVGHQDRVEDYLCALDLFVTPSREESFGLTTVEAMALGLPVVGFRAAGTAEIVVDGQTGLLADPAGDAAAELTRLVLQMAQNRQRSAAMGIAARERAVAMFSSNAMIQRLDQQLQSLPLRTS